jgi:nitrate reductase NapAB chaperone NapD
MPVSGVVLVLSEDVAARDAVLEALAREPGLTLGERMDDRLPVVAETASTPACTALLERLAAIEGVRAVLPVFHDFTDEPGDGQEERLDGAS